MSWSVQEVEGIFLAVLGIFHLHGVALDGDALLLLQIHRIQHLSLHLAAGYRIRCLQHPVRKRGFAVIYGYYNNLGVVEMQKGNADKAAEYFYMAQGENGEVIDSAKENLGALLIQDGDVDGALEILNGTDGFIHGLALVLKGRNDEALKHLKQEYNPDESYLRAIIAARKGDVTTCENELVKAFEKKCYEERIEALRYLRAFL